MDENAHTKFWTMQWFGRNSHIQYIFIVQSRPTVGIKTLDNCAWN